MPFLPAPNTTTMIHPRSFRTLYLSNPPSAHIRYPLARALTPDALFSYIYFYHRFYFCSFSLLQESKDPTPTTLPQALITSIVYISHSCIYTHAYICFISVAQLSVVRQCGWFRLRLKLVGRKNPSCSHQVHQHCSDCIRMWCQCCP